MPAPLDVNREAVRTLAVAVGVREAARQMGLSENTVSAWSNREGWMEKPQEPELPPTMLKQTASSAIKPAIAMGNALEKLGGKTKIVQAKAVYSGSKAIAKLPGKAIIANAGQLKQLVDSADKLHGWSKNTDSPSLISIHIAPAQPTERPVIDISPENV